MIKRAPQDKKNSTAKSVHRVVGQGKTGRNLTPRHPGTNNTGVK